MSSLRSLLLAVLLGVTVASVAAAGDERIGGLAVSRVPPPSHAAVPVLDETGCRVPMLVARCRDGAVELIWAFDMEIAPGAETELGFALRLGGHRVEVPDAEGFWPLSANRRTARLPPDAQQALLSASADSGEAALTLEDPASGSTLHDRFDLTAFAAALAGLDCP